MGDIWAELPSKETIARIVKWPQCNQKLLRDTSGNHREMRAISECMSNDQMWAEPESHGIAHDHLREQELRDCSDNDGALVGQS